MYAVAQPMSAATTEAGVVAAHAERAATMGKTAVAARLSAICDMIEEHHDTGTPISARRAATISAMIDDLATTAAEGKPRTFRRKRRMGSASRYQELCRLGEGLFGVVAKARHRGTGEVVAVKSLKPRSGDDDDDDEDAVRDLLREASFMAACRGLPSHVVSLRHIARSPGTRDYSLVMDYAGTATLLDAMERRARRPFPEADARRIMRRLLAVAEAIHRRGVVHRDMTPDNFLIGDGGSAMRICDFGAAKYVGEQYPPYGIAGIIAYMSPEELVRNQDHGTPVDCWSLGVVMAELLTDAIPFAGEDLEDQLYQIFDVVGVPGKSAWRALKPQMMDEEVRRWRARQRRLGHRNRLRRLFPEKVLSKDGFEVLKGLLTCDPTKRLTAAAALRCRWFTGDVDDDGPLFSSTAWSQVVSCVGRALGLIRPKALLNLIM